jgi:hypothetical protein
MVSIYTILLAKCQETIIQGIRATKQGEKPHIVNGYRCLLIVLALEPCRGNIIVNNFNKPTLNLIMSFQAIGECKQLK